MKIMYQLVYANRPQEPKELSLGHFSSLGSSRIRAKGKGAAVEDKDKDKDKAKGQGVAVKVWRREEQSTHSDAKIVRKREKGKNPEIFSVFFLHCKGPKKRKDISAYLTNLCISWKRRMENLSLGGTP